MSILTSEKPGTGLDISHLIWAVTGLAWLITVAWTVNMGMGLWGMPGTMGMGLISFVVMWAVMMTAMMFASVAPLAVLYGKTLTSQLRLIGLGSGYLLAWALTGFGAYVLAGLFGDLAAARPTLARAVAVGCFLLAGVYQLTPLKFRCLSHCRSPLGHLMRFLGFAGWTRDVRAGLNHGLYCLGCCWGLMVLMVAFGVMNVGAMVGLAAVIAVEKQWRHGEKFARIVGAICLGWAALIIVVPEAAPGLNPGSVMAEMPMDMPMEDG